MVSSSQTTPIAAKFGCPAKSRVVTTVSMITAAGVIGPGRSYVLLPRPPLRASPRSRFAAIPSQVLGAEHAVERHLVLPELAAIVAGGDPHDPRPARRPDARPGRGLHRGEVEPI